MKFILCSLFVALSILGFAQSKNELPEDLQPIPSHFDLVMGMDDVSDEQILIITNMCQQYFSISQDTALLIAEKAIILSEDHPNGIIRAEALYMLGNVLLAKGDYKKAKQHLEKSKAIASKLGKDEMVANIIKNLGKLEVRRDEYDTAIEYFLESLNFFEKIGDSTEIFSVYFNITGLYFNLSLLDKAEEYTSKGLEIAEALDNNSLRLNAYDAQATIFGQRAVNFFKKAENDTLWREIYLDSVLLFTDRALETLEKTLELAEESGNKLLTAQALFKIAGTYNDKEDYGNGIKFGKEAEILIDELGNNYFRSQNYNYLAVAYMEMGDLEQALSYSKKSLASAEKMGLKVLIGTSHDFLAKIYEKLGQYKKALEHLKKYDSYLLKTNNLDKVQSVADAEAKYESVKQEKQILEQKNDILELESSNAKITKQRNRLIGGGILLGILGFVGYNFFKIRKERNDKIAFAEALIFAQETERKRIARDLHDGVGQSLLLIKKQLAASHETTSENNQLISDTLDEVRSISRDLHPFQLEKFGLTTAIKDVIEKVEKSTDLFITTEIDEIDNLFSDKEEIHFYRILQEALNNIVKHAEATAAKVIITSSENGITTKVMDNGKGYDHEIAIVTTKSLGLRTMYERISSLKGRLKIEKNEPSGTIVPCYPRKMI